MKIQRVLGKVDVAITDSPIMLGSMYTDEKPFKDVCIYEGNKYKNTYNIFVKRKKKYNENGRNQTEEEAKEIDKKIIQMLNDNNVEFTYADGSEEGYNAIVNEILKKLNKPKEQIYLVMEYGETRGDFIGAKVCYDEKEANELADLLMRESPGNRAYVVPVDKEKNHNEV